MHEESGSQLNVYFADLSWITTAKTLHRTFTWPHRVQLPPEPGLVPCGRTAGSEGRGRHGIRPLLPALYLSMFAFIAQAPSFRDLDIWGLWQRPFPVLRERRKRREEWRKEIEALKRFSPSTHYSVSFHSYLFPLPSPSLRIQAQRTAAAFAQGSLLRDMTKSMLINLILDLCPCGI